MLPAERYRRILQQLQEAGRVSATQLARSMGVSLMTARRDLNALAERGLVVRVHGGALLPDRSLFDEPIRTKRSLHPEAKRRIAEAAAGLVRPGQTVILDAGTTTQAVARALLHRRPSGLTVVTSDLDIARAMGEEPRFRVFCVGGLVQPRVLALMGDHALAFLEGIHAHHAFIGTDAFDVHAGVTTRTMEKVRLKRAMVKAAKEATLVADSSKLGRVLLATVSPLSAFRRIITNRPAGEKAQEPGDPEPIEALRQAAAEQGFELVLV
ncbi:DeoR/GlpR family DNA-binding transcription regulator [Carboxydochorda subterranea]|uniref:DeoR/GlpR family DNA-binding transcription regulator n=1 Tax=Carboxydichorda subterranea TaxID=3109565 RepID=A0ABZ1BVJ2_9FIRM|nr:DeoR/GlpR family DNA-binding transcription regulator [Limnochorda sp. L945t]WRP16546.1 DeoR/GlpR family DNA-binding transcription regulator [Limnochorda sp. L945t]